MLWPRSQEVLLLMQLRAAWTIQLPLHGGAWRQDSSLQLPWASFTYTEKADAASEQVGWGFRHAGSFGVLGYTPPPSSLPPGPPRLLHPQASSTFGMSQCRCNGAASSTAFIPRCFPAL